MARAEVLWPRDPCRLERSLKRRPVEVVVVVEGSSLRVTEHPLIVSLVVGVAAVLPELLIERRAK